MEAAKLEAWYQKFKDRGFIVITLIGQNAFQNAPDAGSLDSWVSDYSLTHPVVADPNFGVTGRFLPPGVAQIGLPSTSLIAPGMEVQIADAFVSESAIEALLPR